MEKKLDDFNLNGTNLVRMVWEQRKLIIIIGIVAFVVSLIISFLITPQFNTKKPSPFCTMIFETAGARKLIFVPLGAKSPLP